MQILNYFQFSLLLRRRWLPCVAVVGVVFGIIKMKGKKLFGFYRLNHTFPFVDSFYSPLCEQVAD